MKQGYIHLLPYMLKFLEGTRQIVRYHDVTPGSQITWNTAFLAVTGAWKRGGEEEVRFLLEVLNEVTRTPESELSSEMRKARLNIYQDCNDAFRKLLLGKFGRLPLGFPADWVYESAFGSEWKSAIANRTEASPLELSLIHIYTTHEQMKMFLTRMGFGSRVVVTGDTSQIDLPVNPSSGRARSGLVHALAILDKIPGLAVHHFSKADVVRHPLVGAIVNAYDNAEKDS